MVRRSAGLLLYRLRRSRPEVLLVHPGGPFWTNKDEAAWSIPKGEYAPGEDALAAAKREFAEETGAIPSAVMKGEPVPLGAFRQPSAKIIDVWAVEGELDPAALCSNTFAMEWPPGSGRLRDFPEVDRAGWFSPEKAMHKLHKGQHVILAAFLAWLAERRRPRPRRR
ncbi:MAG TPA: NUDIX domain-containing protein [Hyphomicrobiaceae bacterium]|nr:NUDIX domain-containing protein [Hyphomicrobiaceae bacterium]